MIPPDKDVLKEAIKQGFTVKGLFGKSVYHKGSHPKYTQQIEDKIQELSDLYDTKGTPNAAQIRYFQQQVELITTKAKKAIRNGNGLGVNELNLNL